MTFLPKLFYFRYLNPLTPLTPKHVNTSFLNTTLFTERCTSLLFSEVVKRQKYLNSCLLLRPPSRSLFTIRKNFPYFPSGQMSSTFCLGLCKLISTKSTFFFSIISINFVCSVKRKRALLRSNPPRDSRANGNRWEAQSQCLVEMLPIVFKVYFCCHASKTENLDKRLAYLCFFVSESGTSAFSFCG